MKTADVKVGMRLWNPSHGAIFTPITVISVFDGGFVYRLRDEAAKLWNAEWMMMDHVCYGFNGESGYELDPRVAINEPEPGVCIVDLTRAPGLSHLLLGIPNSETLAELDEIRKNGGEIIYTEDDAS